MTKPSFARMNAWRNRLLTYCLRLAVGVGFIALVPSLIICYSTSLWLVFWLDLAAYALVVAITIAKRLPYLIRASAFVLVLITVAIALLSQLGPWGSGVAWLFAAMAFGALLLGRQGALVVGLIIGAGVTVLGALLHLGVLAWPIGAFEWAVHMINVMAAATAVCLATDYLVTRIEASFVRQRNYHHVLLRQNRRLRSHSRRQDELVHELHHRVKNNLQLLSSLLSIDEEEGNLDAMELYQSRVQCLALTHELLNSDGGEGTIDGEELLTEVRDHVVSDHRQAAPYHWCSVEASSLHFDAHSAGPLGLLVNEFLHAWLTIHREPDRPTTCALRLSAQGATANLTLEASCEHELAEAFVDRVYGSGAHLIEALVGQLHGSLSAGQEGRDVRLSVTIPYTAPRATPADGRGTETYPSDAAPLDAAAAADRAALADKPTPVDDAAAADGAEGAAGADGVGGVGGAAGAEGAAPADKPARAAGADAAASVGGAAAVDGAPPADKPAPAAGAEGAAPVDKPAPVDDAALAEGAAPVARRGPRGRRRRAMMRRPHGHSSSN